MKLLSIMCAKAAIVLGKILKRGSVLPGRVAKKIDKNILAKLKLPKNIIAVTGSSGKGGTSSLIAYTYRKLGYTVTYNDKGSNLDDAIITTLIENCDLKGNVKSDIVVLEIDERYTKIVFPKIKPKYVVITNLTRDQPPRQGNVDIVYHDILKALTSSMHLILNGDDPYLQKFVIDNPCKVTYYSLNKTMYSYGTQMFKSSNMVYCPKCHHRLIYDYYHFEELGKYHCSNCDFKNPDISYEITNLNFDKQEMVVDNTYKIKLPNDMLFSVYNTMSAFSAIAVNGESQEEVAKIISSHNNDNSIYSKYKHNKRNVYVLNNKNENSTSYNQSLLLTNRIKTNKTIIIGWKEISRRYKYNDISWLYDVDFEILNNNQTKKVICVGINKYDIATRIKYSGVNEDKIVICSDLEETKELLDKDKNDIIAILNFDYVKPFNDLMEE